MNLASAEGISGLIDPACADRHGPSSWWACSKVHKRYKPTNDCLHISHSDFQFVWCRSLLFGLRCGYLL